MSNDEPRPLRESVTGVARDLGLPDPETYAHVDAIWREIVGDVLATHARVRALRDGICTIGVDGPAWATQLRYVESEVVDRVHAALGAGVVRELRIVVSGS